MAKRNPPAGRTGKIIYWVATIWLALGMVSTGIVQLLKQKEGPGAVDSMTQLGYPLYLLIVISIWKLMGVVAVLIPRYPLLKEWAYAGFFFVMSGAIVSHIAVGDQVSELFPALLLLVLTIISWYFRPSDRKLVSVNQ